MTVTILPNGGVVSYTGTYYDFNALAAPSAEYRLSKSEDGASRTPEGITAKRQANYTPPPPRSPKYRLKDGYIVDDKERRVTVSGQSGICDLLNRLHDEEQFNAVLREQNLSLNDVCVRYEKLLDDIAMCRVPGVPDRATVSNDKYADWVRDAASKALRGEIE